MLTTQHIEAELSYAYPHAVTAEAGFACQSADRVADAFCVDATIREDGRALAADSLLSFSVDVQLKAAFRSCRSRMDDSRFRCPSTSTTASDR